ncbi:MAG: adenylate kinase family protein, partial [Vulcanimicrobiaceae bacterium]
LQATVLVDVPRPELIARLTGRWSNPRTGRSYHALYDPPKRPAIDDDDGGPLVQRSDDSLEVVTNRLETYDAQTQPLVEYYERAGLLARIDGMQPVETVTERIVQSLADRPGVPR